MIRSAFKKKFQHSAILKDEVYMYVFGGENDNSLWTNDFLQCNIDTNSWEDLTSQAQGRVGQIKRDGHTAVYSSQHNTMVLLGGSCSDYDSASTQKLQQYSFDSGKWSEIECSGVPPPLRKLHTAVIVDKCKMVIFGGLRVHQSPFNYDRDIWAQSNFYNDLYELDIDTKRWQAVASIGAPSARRGHSSVVISKPGESDSILVFGGRSSLKYFCDVHVLDYAKRRWSEIKCTGSIPAAREQHCAVVVNDSTNTSRKMIVSGGWSVSGVKGDFYELDLQTFEWRQIHTDVSGARRFGHSCVFSYNDYRLVCYGGRDQHYQMLDDTETFYYSLKKSYGGIRVQLTKDRQTWETTTYTSEQIPSLVLSSVKPKVSRTDSESSFSMQVGSNDLEDTINNIKDLRTRSSLFLTPSDLECGSPMSDTCRDNDASPTHMDSPFGTEDQERFGELKVKEKETSGSIVTLQVFLEELNQTIEPTPRGDDAKEGERAADKSELNKAHREKVRREFLSTEQSYVEGLQTLDKMYLTPLEPVLEKLKKLKLKILQIRPDLLTVTKINEEFLKEIEVAINHKTELEFYETVRKFAPSFSQYSPFLIKYHKTCLELQNTELYQFLNDQRKILKERGNRTTDVYSFLIMPVQRLPRYKLLLEDMLRHMEDTSSPEYSLLSQVIKEIQVVAKNCEIDMQNWAKVEEIHNNLNLKDILVDSRTLIFEGKVDQILKKGKSKTASIDLYIFNDLVVATIPLSSRLSISSLTSLRNKDVIGTVEFPIDGSSTVTFSRITDAGVDYAISISSKTKKKSVLIKLESQQQFEEIMGHLEKLQ